jgi:oligoendopeptidase F
LRKTIYDKVNEARLSKSKELDQLYTELIRLRDKVAKQADHANYRDYKMDALGRFDYTAEDCFTFHSAIEAECVPLNNKS